jgi:hypothetical protein
MFYRCTEEDELPPVKPQTMHHRAWRKRDDVVYQRTRDAENIVKPSLPLKARSGTVHQFDGYDY